MCTASEWVLISTNLWFERQMTTMHRILCNLNLYVLNSYLATLFDHLLTLLSDTIRSQFIDYESSRKNARSTV